MFLKSRRAIEHGAHDLKKTGYQEHEMVYIATVIARREAPWQSRKASMERLLRSPGSSPGSLAMTI